MEGQGNIQKHVPDPGLQNILPLGYRKQAHTEQGLPCMVADLFGTGIKYMIPEICRIIIIVLFYSVSIWTQTQSPVGVSSPRLTVRVSCSPLTTNAWPATPAPLPVCSVFIPSITESHMVVPPCNPTASPQLQPQ